MFDIITISLSWFRVVEGSMEKVKKDLHELIDGISDLDFLQYLLALITLLKKKARD